VTDAERNPRHSAADHCGYMTDLRIGERITLNGRDFEIVGFTSMSVKPKRIYLRDVKSDEPIAILADELSGERRDRRSANRPWSGAKP